MPTFIIGLTFFDLIGPASLARGFAFVLSVLLAVIASFCLRFIANLFGFWVIDYRGLAMMYMALLNLLSGMLAPIAFLPGPLKAIANVLPFRAVIMTPNEIYFGHVTIWAGLGFQLLWISALVLGSRYLLHIGERKLVVHGG